MWKYCASVQGRGNDGCETSGNSSGEWSKLGEGHRGLEGLDAHKIYLIWDATSPSSHKIIHVSGVCGVECV